DWSSDVCSSDLIQKNDTFIVQKWFNRFNEDLLLENNSLKADSIFTLSERLLEQMEQDNRKKYSVLPINHNDVTLLICIDHRETFHVVPFVTYALQIFNEGRETLHSSLEEQQWKDYVILFNDMILLSSHFQ